MELLMRETPALGHLEKMVVSILGNDGFIKNTIE